ncbi:rRNA maturation RNase YbeY [Changchengzhania lutea]|uniref:rRNA maturation RNase YbeY n=1 Tax=Changchengzhania lutea TaxID=2049305 RepID=UPI00115EE81A|nr:rRNA maturation RNase YbeY [Changchengzhania lutea]
MISFNYETDFQLEQESTISAWISEVILKENFKVGDINYIFCTDVYLHQMNVEFLNHDTLTDVISFDYSVGKIIQGDIFISIDRVVDNAKDFEVSFLEELHRVMAHGVLHYCGYKDKNELDAATMRQKENQYLDLL